jgi:hypothetical protein
MTMTHYKVSGEVALGDGYRCSADQDEKCGSVHIGDIDIVDQIHEHKWQHDVVALVNGVVVATGAAVTEVGWGYSEYTPMDEDVLQIDGVSLLDVLRQYAGKDVTLEIMPASEVPS